MVERRAVQVPVTYPTSFIFLDESRARASGERFFVIAALKVRNPGALSRALTHIKDERGLNTDKFEFKFRAVTDGTLRAYYDAVRLLEDDGVRVYATVVDTEQYDPFKQDREFWQVHADIVTLLLKAAINRRELVSVAIDRISTPKGIAYDDQIRTRVNRSIGNTSVVGCLSLDSRTCELLQLADLVAGSIAWCRAEEASTYKMKDNEKKKLAAHVKAALGGVDFKDGKSLRLNIATYHAPVKMTPNTVDLRSRSRRQPTKASAERPIATGPLAVRK